MKKVLTYTAIMPAMPMNGLGNAYAPADYSLEGTSVLCFKEILQWIKLNKNITKARFERFELFCFTNVF